MFTPWDENKKKYGDILQMQKENLLATAFKDERQILFLSTETASEWMS